MKLTNNSYTIFIGTKNFSERYYRNKAGWLKVSARGRTFRMTAEQVLNHILPAVAGIKPNLTIRVKHRDANVRPDSLTSALMTVAALYDIHGNLPALEAVLEDVARAGADRVVVGGDVVPGPMPRETLVRLLELDLPFQFIVGNGELAVLAEMNGRDSGIACPISR